MNDKPVDDIQTKANVLPCIENEENGVYFGLLGGYLKVICFILFLKRKTLNLISF
jgi:hypothetical protein